MQFLPSGAATSLLNAVDLPQMNVRLGDVIETFPGIVAVVTVERKKDSAAGAMQRRRTGGRSHVKVGKHGVECRKRDNLLAVGNIRDVSCCWAVFSIVHVSNNVDREEAETALQSGVEA